MEKLGNIYIEMGNFYLAVGKFCRAPVKSADRRLGKGQCFQFIGTMLVGWSACRNNLKYNDLKVPRARHCASHRRPSPVPDARDDHSAIIAPGAMAAMRGQKSAIRRAGLPRFTGDIYFINTKFFRSITY
jgi:hypothetical protein